MASLNSSSPTRPSLFVSMAVNTLCISACTRYSETSYQRSNSSNEICLCPPASSDSSVTISLSIDWTSSGPGSKPRRSLMALPSSSSSILPSPLVSNWSNVARTSPRKPATAWMRSLAVMSLSPMSRSRTPTRNRVEAFLRASSLRRLRNDTAGCPIPGDLRMSPSAWRCLAAATSSEWSVSSVSADGCTVACLYLFLRDAR
mmetsp:Transcript_84525/g.204977  ORF Transcript_84525/g.204977 Transcript_84525/m.204977 type:complete len:202 (-) Transcript_84525:557-1162(-)